MKFKVTSNLERMNNEIWTLSVSVGLEKNTCKLISELYKGIPQIQFAT